MVKLRRKFDWKEILGDKAWLAEELAEKIGMHVMTLRRYLRFATNAGVLIEQRYGRYKYYATREAWEEYLKKKRSETRSESGRAEPERIKEVEK